MLATVIDISERHRSRQLQHLLITELQHRTRNLFAVIQAIAAATLFKGKTPAEEKQAFYGRLTALAAAFAGDGELDEVSLAEIVQRQIEGFSDRVTVTGCDVIIATAAAQQFALIVHELATNAVKYGALSLPGGSVAVEGRSDPPGGGKPLFHFLWREAGGPPVVAPTRRGFGTTILLDAPRSFGASARADFIADGLSYELHVPLAAIQPPDLPLAAQHSQAGGAPRR